MSNEMNALELSKFIDEDADMGADEYFKAAEMLRSQYLAIQKLRESLEEMSTLYIVHPNAVMRAKQALKDTEEFK